MVSQACVFSDLDANACTALSGCLSVCLYVCLPCYLQPNGEECPEYEFDATNTCPHGISYCCAAKEYG